MSKREQLLKYLTTYAPNPLVLLWFLSATAFYVALGIVDPLTPGVQAFLFIEMNALVPWVPIVWGWLGITSMALQIVGIITNKAWMTRVFSILQVVLWFFAGFAYLMGGYVMLFLAVAFPHILFWSWNQAVRYDHDRIVTEVKSGYRRTA